MSRRFLAAVTALCALAGCAITQNVSPVGRFEDSRICVIENPAVVQQGFIDAYKQALQAKGFAVEILPANAKITDCPTTSTYTGNWRWDLALYMAYAEIKVFREGKQVGEAVYDAMAGGANLSKFIRGEEKIRELVDLLYPAGARASPSGSASAVGGGAFAASAAVPNTSPAGTGGELKRGDQVIYKVADVLTRVSREVTYVVDRIDTDRTVFNQGGYIESRDGKVLSVSSPIAGHLDACVPPDGWARPAMKVGMQWSSRYVKTTGACEGDFALNARVVSQAATATSLGELNLVKIEYRGSGRTPPGIQTAYTFQVWHSPELNRVVRFESEIASSGSPYARLRRERADLIAIRRD